MKRILALIGVILLLGMYIVTFVFAMMKNPASDGLFKASIFCTLTIPILLYGYQLVYKLLKNRNNPVAPPADGSDIPTEDKTVK